MSILLAQAPGHSALNWKIEMPWSWIRRWISGQHFGRSALSDGIIPNVPAEGSVGSEAEDKLREITNAALTEYIAVVRKGAEREGRNVQADVRLPVARDPPVAGGEEDLRDLPDESRSELFADIALVREYYRTTSARVRGHGRFAKIRQEARNMSRHVFKVPSCITFTMCTRLECAECQAIIAERRVANPEWHPSLVLAPLAANRFRMYMPVLEGSPVAADAGDDGAEGPAARAIPYGPEDVPTYSKNERGPYRSLLDMLSAKQHQKSWDIPVNKQAKKWERVLSCPRAGCCYFSKTDAEFWRHAECACGLGAEKVAAAPPPADPEEPPQTFDVGSAAPVLPPPKKKLKAAHTAAGGGEPEGGGSDAPVDPEDEESEGPPDGGEDDAWAEHQRRLNRAKTPASFRCMIPGAGNLVGTHLTVNNQRSFFRMHYLAADFTEEDMEILSVEERLKQKTFQRSFRGQDPEGPLGLVLEWAWDKHSALTGEVQPAEVLEELCGGRWRADLAAPAASTG